MAKHQPPGSEATGLTLPATADRLLLRMVWRCGHWAALLAITSIAGAVADTLLPAVVGRTVDVTLRAAAGAASRAGGLGHPFRWLAGCVALIVVILACETLGQFASGMSTAASTEWLRHRLAGHVFASGLRLSERFPVGDLVGRLIGGAADAGYASASGVRAIAAVIPPVGSLIALALIDPWLAVAFAAGLPALAIVIRSFVREASDTTTRYQQAQGAITARLLDALAGARTIAAAGTRDQEAARVLVPLAQVSLHGRAFWRIQARVAAQGSLVVPLLQLVVLAVAGLELAAHRISPGELLAASQYAVLGAGVGAALGKLNQIARARAGARRAAEPLAEPVRPQGVLPLPPGPGRLELREVTLVRDGEQVLDRLDFTVPGGALVAVVGRSGAGKSLLAALAGRLLDPDEGEVMLDGIALPKLDRGELRRAVVYAFDRPALFGQTPREAISFGVARPTPAALLSATRDASALKFLQRLPSGLDTRLDEAPMSGGEIQRIGLARAFAHADAARLLILDDAMSSLDTVTEMQVSRALTARRGHRTCLIIAHRATTAGRADLVAWLDSGKLRALRPHDVLWEDPDYRAVFSTTAAASGAANG
ncbi:MAG TPA: ABC transporter ATP-binding protein [Streptosporangiaceae bacterium]|jgi:ATP-binding cassette subfamily B protein|nr:ABC transporter ATP-binding protein [Streptosporangiaceae bacterium]